MLNISMVNYILNNKINKTYNFINFINMAKNHKISSNDIFTVNKIFYKDKSIDETERFINIMRFCNDIEKIPNLEDDIDYKKCQKIKNFLNRIYL
jgi:hypothetical protein